MLLFNFSYFNYIGIWSTMWHFNPRAQDVLASRGNLHFHVLIITVCAAFKFHSGSYAL